MFAFHSVSSFSLRPISTQFNWREKPFPGTTSRDWVCLICERWTIIHCWNINDLLIATTFFPLFLAHVRCCVALIWFLFTLSILTTTLCGKLCVCSTICRCKILHYLRTNTCARTGLGERKSYRLLRVSISRTESAWQSTDSRKIIITFSVSTNCWENFSFGTFLCGLPTDGLAGVLIFSQH